MTNGPAEPAAKLTSTPVDATALIKFSKGDSGRIIPLNKELIAAHVSTRNRKPFRELVQRSRPSWLLNPMRTPLSHYQAPRAISTVGGSLCDVQMLAGHSALSMAQRYIEADAEAQKRVVDLV